MTLDLSHLEWALAKNPHSLRDLLFDSYRENPRYLTYLNDLIYFLRTQDCKNIRNKLNDIDNLYKFQSGISELEFVRSLIQRGKQIDLLPDTYMGMVSPPDLLAVDSQIKAYIEVKRITEDSTIDTILTFLRKFLRENNYPYIINVVLNETMSIPVAGWHERQLKEEIVQKGLQELEAKIKTINLLSLPTEIETNVGKFEIYPSTSGKGFPGIIRTSVIKVSKDMEDKILKKIRHDVTEKAKKRERWTDDHHSKIYIVALDFEEIIVYDEDDMEIALIGNSITVMPPLRIPIIHETEEVHQAKERGWETFLHERYIIPSNRTYLDSNRKGIFFTEPVVKNISGVIGRFRNRLHFIPNPFAFEEINNPRLMNYI